jgi:2-keto-4-pentenoate hydratase/2-oxohepta-3-ene-1,7-dioic acid hydratase in catechol pathway
MRIVRFTPPGILELGSDPHYGILNDQDEILILRGDPLFSGILPLDGKNEGKKVKLSDVKLLAPVIPRSKVVCVGKNYADHAAEMGGVVPEEPIIFFKPNTSVIGPDDIVKWPRMAQRVDYEGELAIVISRICKDVPAEKASDVIFGYTIANDVTARDLQSKDGQWSRAKGFDTFCPLGPWIETEFQPKDQMIRTISGGELKQSAPISEMIFKVPQIIEFISQVVTLLPGDVILTGTPSGIGQMALEQETIISIDGLGELANTLMR